MKADKRVVCINGIKVIADRKEPLDEKKGMDIYVGTTGFCDGDRRQGGRTYVSFENVIPADMIVTLKEGKDGNGTGFEIAASGDDALMTLISAFSTLYAGLMERIIEEEE